MKHNTIVLWALVGIAAGCSASSESAGGIANPGASPPNGYSAGSGGSSGMNPIAISADAGMSSGGGGTTATTAPEQQVKIDYLTPQGGKSRVYVANPTRNTVTIINSSTLAISEQATGDTPSYVATVPGQDVALVINAGSHTLRVIREDSLGAASYPVVAKANAIAISPDGLHAVVWFDVSQVTGSTTSTTGSTQEVSLVSFGSATVPDKVVSVSVGYNPSAVVFSSDSSAAFVVTDDGISELRFAAITGPTVAPFTRIDNGALTLAGPDAGVAGLDAGTAPPADAGTFDGGTALDGGSPSPGDGGTARGDANDAMPDVGPPALVTTGKPVNVSVTKAGDYAIARRDSSAALLLVDLRAKTVSTLLMSSQVTDLDLVDSPAGPQAFAVLRSESALVRIDIPAGFTDASHRKRWLFTGSLIGSATISAKGTYALLYTTAIASKDLAIFDLVHEQVLAAPEIHKTIRAVAIAPDEQTALVLHSRTTPSSSSSNPPSAQDLVDQSYGYTMVQLATGFSKLQLTAADPSSFAITPDSSNVFLLLRDDKASVRVAEGMDLSSFIPQDFPLGSPPTSIAALSPESHKVFVGQMYTDGRISFINWSTGDVQTVTGFALNGRIQQ